MEFLSIFSNKHLAQAPLPMTNHSRGKKASHSANVYQECYVRFLRFPNKDLTLGTCFYGNPKQGFTPSAHVGKAGHRIQGNRNGSNHRAPNPLRSMEMPQNKLCFPCPVNAGWWYMYT